MTEPERVVLRTCGECDLTWQPVADEFCPRCNSGHYRVTFVSEGQESRDGLKEALRELVEAWEAATFGTPTNVPRLDTALDRARAALAESPEMHPLDAAVEYTVSESPEDRDEE